MFILVTYFIFEIFQNCFCKRFFMIICTCICIILWCSPIHIYTFYLLYISCLYITSCLPFVLSHLLPLFEINPEGVCYMVMPKCDKKSECTFKISDIVLSQFSSNTLLACNAICTSTDSSIMWLAMENLFSWMRILACAMCFYNASMFRRIMPECIQVWS